MTDRARDAIAILTRARIYTSADAFLVPAHLVQIGDLLDFEGDSFADTPENERATGFPFELSEVEAVEVENDGDCIVIHTTQGSYGFPPGHMIAISLDRNAPANFYQCGGCDHLHPISWGDCRDDAFRFTASELEDELGRQDVAWWITDESGHGLA